jgi:hypothetical protein
MTHRKLVHTNPKLNDPKLWYRLVYAPDNARHYFVIIVGPAGVVSSVVHAVPKEDFRFEVEQEEEVPAPKKEDVDEFI